MKFFLGIKFNFFFFIFFSTSKKLLKCDETMKPITFIITIIMGLIFVTCNILIGFGMKRFGKKILLSKLY